MRALLPLLLILSGCAAKSPPPEEEKSAMLYCVGQTDYCILVMPDGSMYELEPVDAGTKL
jgi:hypothetical protein